MRRRWMKGLVALIVWLLAAQVGFTEEVAPVPPDKAGGGTPVLTTKKEWNSYSLGVETVKNYKRLGMDIDLDLVIRGMKDADAGRKLLMSAEDIADTMIEFRGEMVAKQRGGRMVAGLDNKKEGQEFLASNKTKEGVVTLPSGLQYKILKAGEGKKPTAEDTVEVYYRGTLINGTEFENNFDTGQPATIKVSDYRVIAGLREAFKLMPVGSKWQLFIPSRLAYVGGGRGIIGPYATLIYEVELLAIK
ncbi:MAG: FKBP-type peptidyl-prolyl cis-trans isomerase [Thermodesulfovibrionales bacterium]